MSNKKLKVTIQVWTEDGQVKAYSWKHDYDSLHNNEWNEIVRGLLDESVSEKEF